jgi:serine-type D-Ala-D-Ala carboxypeptidase/endopeptidase (penicillin-binding protein 4)
MKQGGKLSLTVKIFLGIMCFLPQWSGAQSHIQQAVNALANDPALKHAGLGVCVIEVESGRILAGHQAEMSLVPASSLKVVTTATALGILGPDYTFKTELQYDGEIDARGNLKGNLFLRGYGDPTLGSDQMEGTPALEEVSARFRMVLQQRGIRHIDGYVVGDASWLGNDVNCRSWQWNDLGNYYGAGVWGLNIHENLYYLRFRQSSRLGATPAIGLIEPEVPGLSFYNEVKSAKSGSGDNAYIFGGPYTYERFVRGTIPVGSGLFSIKGSLPDPPLFAAYHFKRSMESIGITSSREAVTQLELDSRGFKSGERKVLFTHYSPPLNKIVERANIKSVNLYCESLLRALGKNQKDDGAIEAGIEVIENYWTGRGLKMDGCYLEDGSGLSARNAVTTLFLATLMREVARDEKVFPFFYDSLPIGGRSGSLEYMFRGSAAEGKVRAKSGTLNRVRSYTGYATSRSGKLLAFSVIVNNYSCTGSAMRSKLERFMTILCQ